MADYAFLTTWLLESPREPVWEAIYDQASWPQWWRGVEEAEEIAPGEDERRRHGRAHGLEEPAALPGRVRGDDDAGRAPHLLQADAVGELSGVGRWRLYEQDGVTAVLYEWNVATTQAWMNLLAPVARPVFEWNHDWVMARGGEGIAESARRRCWPTRLSRPLSFRRLALSRAECQARRTPEFSLCNRVSRLCHCKL